MKTSLKYFLAIIIVCTFIFNSCKKNEEDVASNPTPVVLTPAVTAIGTPIGISNSGTIGASGGTVISFDGRLEIIIPANALSVSTTIAIQPITNQTPGGAGVSYRLTPDGQQFSQPVTIRFHFDSTDVLGTDIHAFGIAFQKADKIWYSLNTIVLDSAAATVSVYTNHFTDWSLYDNLFVIPMQEDVLVNENLQLKVQWVKSEDAGNDLSWLFVAKDYEFPSQVSWTLNGNLQGNQNDGTIAPASNSITTTFSAPPSVGTMSANPAAVTAEVSGIWMGGALKIYLMSNVTVLGKSYYVDVEITGTNVSIADVYINYTDNSSFVVNLDAQNTASIDAIINNPGSQLGTINPGACTGVAVGTGNFLEIDSVIGSTASGQLELIIYNKWTTPGFTENCPGQGTVNVASGTIPIHYIMPVFPIDNIEHIVTLLFYGPLGEVLTLTATPQ